MITSTAFSGREREIACSNKKVLLLFEDNILGRMLHHLFRFAGFEIEKRASQGNSRFNFDGQQECDVALIDLTHPSMMNRLCISCIGNKAEAFPKVILSTLPVKPGRCSGKSEKNCTVMGKPFKTRELVDKLDSFSGISEDKISRKIHQYYN